MNPYEQIKYLSMHTYTDYIKYGNTKLKHHDVWSTSELWHFMFYWISVFVCVHWWMFRFDFKVIKFWVPLIFFETNYFVFRVKTHIEWVWDNMRENKWWRNFYFGLNHSFGENLKMQKGFGEVQTNLFKGKSPL